MADLNINNSTEINSNISQSIYFLGFQNDNLYKMKLSPSVIKYLLDNSDLINYNATMKGEVFNSIKNVADEEYSHAEGYGTIANGYCQHVQGSFNNTRDKDSKGREFLHVIGNGTDENKRLNAHTLDWDGNAWYQGNIKIGQHKISLDEILTYAENTNDKEPTLPRIFISNEQPTHGCKYGDIWCKPILGNE